MNESLLKSAVTDLSRRLKSWIEMSSNNAGFEAHSKGAKNYEHDFPQDTRGNEADQPNRGL